MIHDTSRCVAALVGLLIGFSATANVVRADIVQWDFFATGSAALDGDTTYEGFIRFDDSNPNFNPGGAAAMPT